MVLATKAPEVVAPTKVRILKQTESHIIEMAVTRLDGAANLASAVIDLTRGTVTTRQETVPITFKTPEDFDDLIAFYTEARRLLAERPDSVIATD